MACMGRSKRLNCGRTRRARILDMHGLRGVCGIPQVHVTSQWGGLPAVFLGAHPWLF